MRFRKTKEPRHTSVINITLCVPSGKITDLVTELKFDGLDILHAKDKSVCFVCPKDFEQQAKKRSDIPTKFQKIYEDWAQFDKAITRFKNNIKEGCRQTYNLSIWMGSNKLAEKS